MSRKRRVRQQQKQAANAAANDAWAARFSPVFKISQQSRVYVCAGQN
jgi:hypothetical protein